MSKYLINGGCSFTENETRGSWPRFLTKKLNSFNREVKNYNFGAGSMGADYVSRSVIYGVHQLLSKRNISSDDIFVIVEWPPTPRKSNLVNNTTRSAGVNYRFVFENELDIERYIKTKNSDDSINFNENSIKRNGYIDNDGKLETKEAHIGTKWMNPGIGDYIAILTDDTQLMEAWNDILKLQFYLELNKIDYFFIPAIGGSLTTSPKDKSLRQNSFGELDLRNTFSEHHDNKGVLKYIYPDFHYNETEWIFEDNPDFKWITELLNFDKWIFYESHGSKFLGMIDCFVDHHHNKPDWWQNDMHPKQEKWEWYVDNFLFDRVKDILK
tara:strand:+ start:171 stop:1148 length:978 start_codon:yes stop_codon:yes gene_type:complete